MKELDSVETAATLRQLFGDNRAEWPSTNFKDLFVSPAYLAKLESMRPCFLVGGRGTGKTTSLQSLRYDAMHQRVEAQGLSFDEMECFGVLVRMNKNRVRAFFGSSLDEAQWARLFAHYFNLLVCAEFADMALWLQEKTNIVLSERSLSRVCAELGLEKVKSLRELRDEIKFSLARLQVEVNNPHLTKNVLLSMAEAPLRAFVEVLEEEGILGGRIVFCCIDEYENLLDSQQAVINTYIKHAEPPLSYKVGVRKNGLRNRQTLDGQDLLKTPDDYLEIEIADEGFELFAKAVGELRLKSANDGGVSVPSKLSEFLADLTLSEEAERLGAGKVAQNVMTELSGTNVYDFLKQKPDSEIYFLKYWQETDGRPLLQLAEDWKNNETEWKTRIGNYGYASLFWLSKGNKGARIRKYYCGERVILSLAAGNIRYFLELLDVAIGYELDEAGDSLSKPLCISAKSQTLAARDVGRRRLNQLEGLADHGVHLKRLVLAIGKVFFELAREPNGKAPEVTSFVLSGDSDDVKKAHSLLEEGIAHLAFESAPRTKLTSRNEMRDDEYRLHRIFCAFFEISHRKKRRMTFDAKNLIQVLEDRPSKAISAMLEEQPQSPEDDLPEQLALFSAFYAGESND